VFAPLFRPTTPDAYKDISRENLGKRIAWIDQQLAGKQYLMGDKFTVADAYLVTLLNWFGFVGCDLKKWPTLAAYHQKQLARPAVAKAMGIEMEERKRRAA